MQKKKMGSQEQKIFKDRIDTILYVVRNLKSYDIQVQNMHPSGASEQDIVRLN